MVSAVTDAVSLLALDLGTANTRAHLFDVADGQYRFVATGSAPTTLSAPLFDIGEGIYQALLRLQEITGRILLDKDANFILPSQAGGEGVDRLVVTYSCGKPLNMVTFGLLNEASLESVNRLAASIYGNVIDSYGINDRRSTDARADALLNSKPDLILFAGGSDYGASRSVLKTAEMICRALQVMPAQDRPDVIYAGNQAIADQVKDRLEKYAPVHVAPNVRPQIDHEEVSKVADFLLPVLNQIQSHYVSGLERMASICNAPPETTASAAEKCIRLLSKVNDPQKGVLAFDIGSGSSTAITGLAGTTSVNVFPYGTGTGLQEFLNRVKVERIWQWLPETISLEELRDALYQKTLSPASIPMTPQALQIELAAARQMLREMVHDLRLRNVLTASGYDPILVSGSTLTRAATPQQVLLTLLDGIQPFGMTTFILDKFSILGSLGVAGLVQPFIPIQVLESNAFASLATVICPLSEAKPGTEILHAHLEVDSGRLFEADVKKGSIAVLPLKPGETGKLTLETEHRTRVEATGLAEEYYRVNGGICGLVIDARGRPLDMPSNADLRHKLLQEWSNSLRG